MPGSTDGAHRETGGFLSVRIDGLSIVNAAPVHVARDQVRHVDGAGGGVGPGGGRGISTVDLT